MLVLYCQGLDNNYTNMPTEGQILMEQTQYLTTESFNYRISLKLKRNN